MSHFRTSVRALSLAALLVSGAAPLHADSLSTFGNLTLNPGASVNFSAGSSSGSFAPLGGTDVVIADIGLAAIPPGVPVSVPNFVVFVASPSKSITLTSLAPSPYSSAQCSSPPTAGQICGITGSPYSFVNVTGDSASITFGFSGTYLNAGVPTPIVATITTQVADMSYQEVLATLAAGGSVRGSYSAEMATAGGTVERLNVGGTIALSNTGIDFVGPAEIAGFENDRFDISDGTGVFSGLAGSFGLTLDFGLAPFSPIADYMTLAPKPGSNFNLTQVLPSLFSSVSCGAAPASGQTCSVPGVPGLGFENIAIGGQLNSVGVISVGGTFDSLGLSSTPFTGLYTFQFDAPYQGVLANLLTGVPVSATYSAQFVTGVVTPPMPAAVPEPSTLIMIGTGAAALLRKRRR